MSFQPLMKFIALSPTGLSEVDKIKGVIVERIYSHLL